MYLSEILIPQVTNREDFLLTVSLWDNDLETQINFTGITLANPSAAFTAASWNVTAGIVNTTSSTSITIPVPPIGAQLSPLNITVAPALAITPGLPVTISDAATGLNTMSGYVMSYTSSNGALSVQIGWTFQFEIRGTTPTNLGLDYIDWYDFGTVGDNEPILQATLANGFLTMVDQGTVQILIPESTFKSALDVPFSSQSNTYARTYMAAMTATDSVNTRQIFLGRQPILYGGVTN
jgi:hypothetical protein